MSLLQVEGQAGVDKPTLLNLPPEIRSSILRYVFISRIIKFVAFSMVGLDATGLFSKIYHEWRLSFLGTNRQLRDEGRAALRSIIQDSTLILDGIVPEAENKGDKLDRYLFMRRMLSLFLRQYADDVRALKVTNLPSTNLHLGHFRALKEVVFEQEVFTGFEVLVPDEKQPGAPRSVPFPEFEQRATDLETQEAIMKRWQELKAIGQIPGPMSHYYLTITAFLKLVSKIRGTRMLVVSRDIEQKSFTVLMVLILASQDIAGIHIELVLDGLSDEALSFRRLNQIRTSSTG